MNGKDDTTDQWAKTVVDGMPNETEIVDAEVVDADIVDAEVVDGEVVDGEVVDGEVVDGEVVDAEVVDGEAIHDDVPVAEVMEEVADVEEPLVDPTASGPTDADPSAAGDISVEGLVIDLERVTAERDQYLDASRRLQAEFENYKKQVSKREVEARERANESLVGELLPVLDACDGAVANGAEEVAPMRTSLLGALEKQGLDRIDPGDAPFDPALHEAVMHEDADDVDGPVVAEVMRAGYAWKGRVLRPAMVRTRG